MAGFNETPEYPKGQTSLDIIRALSTGKISIFQVQDIITAFEAAMRIAKVASRHSTINSEDLALVLNKGGRAVKDLNWMLPIN